MMGGPGASWARLAAQAALSGVDPRLIAQEDDPLVREWWATVVHRAYEERVKMHRQLASEIAAAVSKLFKR